MIWKTPHEAWKNVRCYTSRIKKHDGPAKWKNECRREYNTFRDSCSL